MSLSWATGLPVGPSPLRKLARQAARWIRGWLGERGAHRAYEDLMTRRAAEIDARPWHMADALALAQREREIWPDPEPRLLAADYWPEQWARLSRWCELMDLERTCWLAEMAVA